MIVYSGRQSYQLLWHCCSDWASVKWAWPDDEVGGPVGYVGGAQKCECSDV